MFGFLNVGVLDIIDIILVSILFYNLYKVIKNSVAMNIFLGIAALYVVWEIVSILNLDLLSLILGKFMSVGFILLVILFQKEIRNFLTIIGTSKFKLLNTRLKKMRDIYLIEDITDFLYEMSKLKVGILIVLEKNTNLNFLIETGDIQDIKVTKSILECIFSPKGPLHDGAVIISRNGRIISTRSILPISSNTQISSKYGMRHRAALGITEETDCACLIVSEETGTVSCVENGCIENFSEKQLLIDFLNNKIT